MSTPKRIQRKRTKGWRMPAKAVYVGRPTKWGNPFTIGCEAWRFSTDMPHRCPANWQEVVENYEHMIQLEIAIGYRNLKELRGKDLACWCPLDRPCHADVLLRLANGLSDSLPEAS
jgi:hypothetical protein